MCIVRMFTCKTSTQLARKVENVHPEVVIVHSLDMKSLPCTRNSPKLFSYLLILWELKAKPNLNKA